MEFKSNTEAGNSTGGLALAGYMLSAFRIGIKGPRPAALIIIKKKSNRHKFSSQDGYNATQTKFNIFK